VSVEPFRRHTGLVLPLDRANVDTDQIIPQEFLKRLARTGFGEFLFYRWRYVDGQPNPDFVLNQPRYRSASVLLARQNFGCGSSREHAVWALADYGFRVLIAPSFADIFYHNCFQNGLLPINLDGQLVEDLFRRVTAQPGYRLSADLENCTLTGSDGFRTEFSVDSGQRRLLLSGRDLIALTLEHAAKIEAYEAAHRPRPGS